MKQYWTLAFLTLTGLAYGQEIIIPPADTTAVVGSNISFFCRVGFGPIETMSWEFNEAIVYSLQDGYEHYPCTSCGNKYTVTRNAGNFTLRVNALDLNDAGKYTCIAMVPSATAVLIVLDTPKISKSALSSAEGSIAEYTCKAQFAMPPKSEVLPKQNPVLGMFLAETTLNGVVREGNCDGLTNCYFYTQTEDLTLEASMNGKQLMCDISTSQPSMHVNNSTMITVLYSVRNISYTPDNGQYEIGTKITCLAEGNPKPQYVWNNMNTGESIDGQTLYMTEEMLGPNTWRCIAKNAIDENPYKEITEVDFAVVMTGDYKEAGNASLGIGLGATFAVCVLAIILTLLYCRIKHKKPMCYLPIRKKGQKSQDQVEKENKTKDSDTTQQMEFPLIKSTQTFSHQETRRNEYLSSREEMFPGDKGRKMKEIRAPGADETMPLLTKNIAEDNNGDESKDEYSKQQSLKLQETPYNSTIPEIQDHPQSREPQLTKTSEDKNTDADIVQEENSRSENSDGSRLVPEDAESSTSDGVYQNEQKPEDNQNSNSGNADDSPSENDDTAQSKAMSQGTSPENDTSSNHSSNGGTEDDARAVTTSILQPQSNTETTKSISCNSDAPQPDENSVSASPTETGEMGSELDEADTESHSTEKGINQPHADTGENSDESEGTDKKIQSTVEGTSQHHGELKALSDNQTGNTSEKDNATTISQISNTPTDPPTPPVRQKNQGNFGEIVKGKIEDKDVTIFRHKKFQTAYQKEAFFHGGELLKIYNHRNIAKFIKISGTEEIYMMAMEYEPGGVLRQFLQINEKELGKSRLIKMCEDVLDGMVYLEKKPCIHRALGAHSCLVGENKTVKIFNFSWAKEAEEYHGDPHEPVPIRSASPEALKQAKYSFSSDVWSFGVLMWEVFSFGEIPYGEDGETKEKLLSRLERGNILKTPEGTPSSISKLSETCLKTDPKRRPSSRLIAIKIKDAYKS